MDELTAQIRDALEAAAAATGRPELQLRPPRSTDTADSALRAAELATIQALSIPPGGRAELLELTEVLVRLTTLRGVLRDTEADRRAGSMTNVSDALRRLRVWDSVEELVKQTPVELRRLGYGRTLVSRLSRGVWTARAAFAEDDPHLAAALVRVGQAVPGRLGRELPETEVVRQRTAVLVRDARRNPRVHHELRDLLDTAEYVAAPLIVAGVTVGIVHVDRHIESGTVDEFDREVLALFSEGLGCILEQAMVTQRLAQFRQRIEEQARAIDTITASGFDLDPPPPTPDRPAQHLAALEGPLAELTRRELEVLRRLAAGQSNPQIAHSLFVSPSTVKTHVKNLLRKLVSAIAVKRSPGTTSCASDGRPPGCPLRRPGVQVRRSTVAQGVHVPAMTSRGRNPPPLGGCPLPLTGQNISGR